MAELWGGILKFFGILLAGIYRVIPSYGIALILLTLVTRLVIAPLGVKQIRSMQQMQKLQPKIKELQKKYKGDRQKLNEEMMKLYKEHGANPLGGCFPLLAQFPVFIALYAVIRSAIPIEAVPPAPISVSVPAKALCTPALGSATTSWVPSVNGTSPDAVSCGTQETTFSIDTWKTLKTKVQSDLPNPPSYLAHCAPQRTKDPADTTKTLISGFVCQSPLGTGHIPKDSKLFEKIVDDDAGFLGMQLACSPKQAGSSTEIKQCTSREKKASGGGLVVYYLLVAAMAGSTYWQQRQMAQRATGQQAQQMKMMGVMMPVLFGYLSLQFPAALSLYWVTGNIWTIAQQKIIFGKEESTPAGSGGDKPKRPPKKGKP